VAWRSGAGSSSALLKVSLEAEKDALSRNLAAFGTLFGRSGLASRFFFFFFFRGWTSGEVKP
jgi:hypothetical protein